MSRYPMSSRVGVVAQRVLSVGSGNLGGRLAMQSDVKIISTYLRDLGDPSSRGHHGLEHSAASRASSTAVSFRLPVGPG
jgi:hypothetical protein